MGRQADVLKRGRDVVVSSCPSPTQGTLEAERNTPITDCCTAVENAMCAIDMYMLYTDSVSAVSSKSGTKTRRLLDGAVSTHHPRCLRRVASSGSERACKTNSRPSPRPSGRCQLARSRSADRSLRYSRCMRVVAGRCLAGSWVLTLELLSGAYTQLRSTPVSLDS